MKDRYIVIGTDFVCGGGCTRKIGASRAVLGDERKIAQVVQYCRGTGPAGEFF
jgi:hypothetical protein